MPKLAVYLSSEDPCAIRQKNDSGGKGALLCFYLLCFALARVLICMVLTDGAEETPPDVAEDHLLILWYCTIIL
jgi:hypothetical protein